MRNKNMIEPQNTQCVQTSVTSSSVLHGDCLEIMKTIPDESIDMILADLPYGTTACKWDVIIPFHKLWEQYERIIKPNGAIVLTASQPFTSALIMSNPKLFKVEWIWQKNSSGNFAFVKYQPLKVHENILVFGGKNYYPIKQPRQGSGLNRLKAGYKSNGTKSQIGSITGNRMGKEYDDLKFPDSIQLFKNKGVEVKYHPTQKPVSLFEYLIKTYTNEGDLVLDNCAGSGTTGIACINTNRNYILIEKEQKYFDVINERILKHNNLRNGEFSFDAVS